MKKSRKTLFQHSHSPNHERITKLRILFYFNFDSHSFPQTEVQIKSINFLGNVLYLNFFKTLHKYKKFDPSSETQHQYRQLL